jgi:hypothetical protein
MILTVEVRRGDGPGRQTVVEFVRISALDDAGDRTDYGVGAIENANPSSGIRARTGCVVEHDRRDGPWALMERACAGLRKADFIDLCMLRQTAHRAT